jgi:hypothetical protein
VTYFWWYAQTETGVPTVGNGTVFFMDFTGRLFAVTAAHVYLDGYLPAKRRFPNIACKIGNLDFDPETRLRGHREGLDIVTFEFSYSELASIWKQAVLADPAKWPLADPVENQAVFIQGFPRETRLWLTPSAVSFGLYQALTPITLIVDRQITCRFESDRWVDTLGKGLPSSGFDLGGISGGPLLIPADTDGEWRLELGGVISQAPRSPYFESVVAIRSHFINPDGSISRL